MVTAQPSIPGLFADTDWQQAARKAVLRLPIGWEFTSDDLHKWGIGEPNHKNHYGALFRALARSGDLVYLCHVRSLRPESRGRMIGLWRRERTEA